MARHLGFAVRVLAGLAISATHAAEQPAASIAGSYQILICKGECAASEQNVVVKGEILLFAASLNQQKLAEHRLRGRFMSAPPNGCFGLGKTGRPYDGYAGIEEAGLTTWSTEEEELRFALYHSADAGYRVAMRRTATGFAGTGRSWGAGVAAATGPALDQVVLRRTGAADLSRCPRAKD